MFACAPKPTYCLSAFVVTARAEHCARSTNERADPIFQCFFAVELCYAESLNERRRCICHLCAITCTCSSRRVLCLLWVKDRASSIMRPTRDAICLFRCILQKLCRPIAGLSRPLHVMAIYGFERLRLRCRFDVGLSAMLDNGI